MTLGEKAAAGVVPTRRRKGGEAKTGKRMAPKDMTAYSTDLELKEWFLRLQDAKMAGEDLGLGPKVLGEHNHETYRSHEFSTTATRIKSFIQEYRKSLPGKMKTHPLNTFQPSTKNYMINARNKKLHVRVWMPHDPTEVNDKTPEKSAFIYLSRS